MLKLTPATALLCLVLSASASEITFDFSQYPTGRPPPGFVSLVTGQGPPGDWKIMDEMIAPTLAPLLSNMPSASAKHSVLTQSSQDSAANHSPVLIFTNETFAGFTLTTRFKIVSGATDPSAGVIFRAQDQNNYYVIRASTRGNLLWYRVVNGVRYENDGIGVKIAIPAATWQELKVECSGAKIRCYLNGKLVLPPGRPGAPTADLAINDSTFSTGHIGFWTGGDTVASFTAARIDYTPRVPQIQAVVTEVMKKYPRLLGLRIYALKNSAPVVIADALEQDLGAPGGKAESECIGQGTIMYGKQTGRVEVELPLRDRNGDIVAALKTVLKSFPGETSDTAVGRATLVKKAVEVGVDALRGIDD